MVSNELKCIQVHIPKTAGVSIRKSLFNVEPNKNMHWYPDHPEYQKYWNEYFTFTFVRNPWDRIVSCYEFCFHKPNHVVYKQIIQFNDFKEFLLNMNLNHVLQTQRFQPQLNWIKDKRTDKEYGLDFIGKFENLENDFKKVCKKIGVKKPKLEILNRNTKRKYRDYKEYYTNDKLIDIVYNIYKEDIERFKYEF